MKTPQISETKARALLSSVLAHYSVALLGVRGYYRDTMGQPGANDVGQYDDAIILVGPGVFQAVQANTDPSRIGWNESLGKPFAMLKPGLWHFIRGPHKGKTPALRQPTEEEAEALGIPDHGHFHVWRGRSMQSLMNGTAPEDTGYFAINMHRGGEETTSSWGCQTIPPEVFDSFMRKVWAVSKGVHQDVLPYLLIDGPVE